MGCAAWVAEMHMEEVTICYGMTETSPVSTQTGAIDLDKRVGTVGRVHPHVEVKADIGPGHGVYLSSAERPVSVHARL